jgi:hypothetical protein
MKRVSATCRGPPLPPLPGLMRAAGPLPSAERSTRGRASHDGDHFGTKPLQRPQESMAWISPWPCENTPHQPDCKISFRPQMPTHSPSGTRILTGAGVGMMFSTPPFSLSFSHRQDPKPSYHGRLEGNQLQAGLSRLSWLGWSNGSCILRQIVSRKISRSAWSFSARSSTANRRVAPLRR